MKRIALIVPLLVAMLFAGGTRAAEIPEALSETLEDLGVPVDRVLETRVPGIYEVSFGTRLIYMSADGRYMLRGNLVDLKANRNLTVERQRSLRQSVLAGLDEREMIVFSGKDPKHTVTVFTDVDCGYCAKLHRELADYLEQGIRIRYMAYPRAGEGSGTARKMISVWCAPDQHEALTRAKAGETVDPANCDNPVMRQYALGAQFGVRGTPTIVLETGDVIPGYAPARDLLRAILEAQAG